MKQPEAIFLATELEAPLGTVISSEVNRRAAAELRRLHAENAEILKALRWCTYMDTHKIARVAISKAENT